MIEALLFLQDRCWLHARLGRSSKTVSHRRKKLTIGTRFYFHRREAGANLCGNSVAVGRGQSLPATGNIGQRGSLIRYEALTQVIARPPGPEKAVV